MKAYKNNFSIHLLTAIDMELEEARLRGVKEGKELSTGSKDNKKKKE